MMKRELKEARKGNKLRFHKLMTFRAIYIKVTSELREVNEYNSSSINKYFNTHEGLH